MPKVTVVGAGNVGATCANVMAANQIASQIVLLDVKEGLAEGKILDISETQTLTGFNTKLVGVTNDYSRTAGSDVVVITSGIPRKPGMSREDLIGVNSGIVKDVVLKALEHSPDAIICVVSNPMDTMTYLACKVTGIAPQRIIGIGGALDSARFKGYVARALEANVNDISGMVIGGHGDTTMIPLASKASCKGVPISDFLDAETLRQVVADTMVGGATLTKLLGTSAWYAPGAAIAMVVESIVNDQDMLIPSSVMLHGEYGQEDICMGVPVAVNRNGAHKIVEIDLTPEEKEAFAKSADAVRATNNVLYDLGVL